MVEMTEVADILKNATPRSLLILDEIGRGTSTFDGMAIARAVLEYAADRKRLGAKTLFATHYHELTDIEQALPGVKNFNIAVKKRQGDMIFLRKIVPGAADDSYGIEVAKLAGIPDRVITRAREILKDLESGAPERAKPAAAPVSDQVSMLDMQSDELRRALEAITVETLTPIEALNQLYQLKQLLPVGADACIGPAECSFFTGLFSEFAASQWADRVVDPYRFSRKGASPLWPAKRPTRFLTG